MEFVKQDNKTQVAQGIDGKFIIVFKHGFYYGTYKGDTKTFNFPRSRHIKDLKEKMKNNIYWED